MMERTIEKTVKQFVTDDYRAAAVFEKYAIDFCCNGGKTLDEACRVNGVDPETVLLDLEDLRNDSGTEAFRPAEWDLDALADFIVNTHHRYVRRTLPVLVPHVEKVLSVHGQNHPELAGIAEHVYALATELTSHMQKEEMVLFPFIKAMVAAKTGQTQYNRPPFGSIRFPIAQMEAEHSSAGDSLSYLRTATQGYTPPADACTTFIITYRELAEFERDLHQHIHLENNILFPRAIALEQSF
ncbi:MAG: Iron-sulfur cluster repair protein YtfE [Bacteroidetes bacterium]|jgi:regulator of cell morphogenesis and NO signaling|nr:Iron-sulfur cluster repair protein YtfE [Bacteroidota bacterium]